MSTEKDTVIEIVQQAGEKTKQFLQKGFTSRSKGGVDFATEADDAVDKFLRESLAKSFPTHHFLTEETAPSDYLSLKTAENLWVIDPIDGTVNFSRGNSHFAISVGLVDKGHTRLGVVYLPLEEKLYWAEESVEESYCNEQPLKVSPVENLSEAMVGCDWSWDLEKRKKTHAILGKILPHVRAVQCRGSAASDIASVAAGELDVYFNFGLKPWDIAATVLIAEKAGAFIHDIHGGEWSVFSPDILVTNGKLQNHMLLYFT